MARLSLDEETLPLLGVGRTASRESYDRSGFDKLYRQRRDRANSHEEPAASSAVQLTTPPAHLPAAAHSRAPSALKSAGSRSKSAPVLQQLKLPAAHAHVPGKERLKSPRVRSFGDYRLSGKKRFCLGDIRSTDIHYEQCGEAPMPEMGQTDPGFLSAAHLRDEMYWREILGESVDPGGPFQWIESNCVHVVVGICILVNAMAMGFSDPGTSLFWLEQLVLVVSLLELFFVVARRHSGIPFKTSLDAKCVALDCMVVGICTMEKWLIPVCTALSLTMPRERNSVARTLLRMIWLFRFLRLIRIVPALNELARGVMDAVQGLFWVLCFMLLLIYAIAILVTRLIGHFKVADMDESRAASEIQEVQVMFRDVRTSMFYLFETMSSWTLVPLIPLFQIAPITRIVFVVFYIYSGWTLLAVMTGVVSFNMIALRAQMTREDEARDQAGKEKANQILLDIFEFGDADRSGELSVEEFDELMKNKDIIETIEAHTNIKKLDLEDLWQWLDDDNSGTISVDEFLRAFQWLNEPFKPRTLLRLQEKITREMRIIKKCFLDIVAATFDSMMLHVQPPMLKMHAITEQVQLLGVACESLQGRLQHISGVAVQAQQMRKSTSIPKEGEFYSLDHFEENFGSQIDMVLERLARFRPTQLHALRTFEGRPEHESSMASQDLQSWQRDCAAAPLARDPLLHDPTHGSWHLGSPTEADDTHSQHTDTENYERHDTEVS